MLMVVITVCMSCSKEPEYLSIIEIGTEFSRYDVSYAAGEVVVKVYSNSEFTASLGDDVNWAVFNENGERAIKCYGDSELVIDVTKNRGLSRRAVMSIVCSRSRIEVEIVQGSMLNGGIEFVDANVLADSAGGEMSSKMLTLIDHSSIESEVSYDDQEGWISGVKIVNNFVVFNIEPNYSDAIRCGMIHLSAVDDLGEEVSGTLYVKQASETTALEPVTFVEMYALLEGGQKVTIDRDYTIEGYILNDNTYGNGGEIFPVSRTYQDYEAADYTIYLESPDGAHGVRILAKDAENNTTSRYDRAVINLNGLTLERLGGGENDPVRYSLSGAERSNILSTTASSLEDLPVKVKRMSELTDDDVYTYVTLRDCEIPVRKGPLSPISYAYAGFMSKYPMLIRDIEGSSMYMMTNTECTYARTGEVMPQGAGTISGVIVHENCDQFEWDAAAPSDERTFDLGNIGRYQIRHISRSDIDLAADFEDGFSEMICEFRYFNRNYEGLVRNVDDNNTIWSTYPPVADPIGNVNGTLTHWPEGTAITAKYEWTQLGPVTADGTFPNLEVGNGVTDYNGVPTTFGLANSSFSYTNGCIYYASTDAGPSWQASRWRRGSNDFCAWLVTFSTENIDADHAPMSIQFGAGNSYGTFGAPRYWKAQYSLDGNAWVDLGEYTVPDFPPLSGVKQYWHLPSYKYVNFTFPSDADVWGKAKVYVRLIPSRDLASNSSGTAYASSIITNNIGSGLCYFAVRYNK